MTLVSLKRSVSLFKYKNKGGRSNCKVYLFIFASHPEAACYTWVCYVLLILQVWYFQLDMLFVEFNYHSLHTKDCIKHPPCFPIILRCLHFKFYILDHLEFIWCEKWMIQFIFPKWLLLMSNLLPLPHANMKVYLIDFLFAPLICLLMWQYHVLHFIHN